MSQVGNTVMYRAQLHAETEVRWHDEVAKVLAGMPPVQPEDLVTRSPLGPPAKQPAKPAPLPETPPRTTN
jgi:hypothetical protein